MTTKKQTLYEMLEVPNTASTSEIKAAHRRLSLALMSGASGLSREDVSFKLNVLDVALHTLSTAMLRDEYDAQIAPAVSHGYAVVPSQAGIVSYGDIAQANRLAAALEESRKLATAVNFSPPIPVKEFSATVKNSFKSLKKIFRIAIWLTVLVSMLLIWQYTLGRMEIVSSEEIARATDLLEIQEYYQKYGVRVANRNELQLIKEDQRRTEREQREAEFAEGHKLDREQQFAEESQRLGASVHEDLIQAEQQAAYEEEARQYALAEEKRQQEEEAAEAERIYVENKRRELGLYQ